MGPPASPTRAIGRTCRKALDDLKQYTEELTFDSATLAQCPDSGRHGEGHAKNLLLRPH